MTGAKVVRRAYKFRCWRDVSPRRAANPCEQGWMG